MKEALDTARGRRSKPENIIHSPRKLTGKKEGIPTELWRECTNTVHHLRGKNQLVKGQSKTDDDTPSYPFYPVLFS